MRNKISFPDELWNDIEFVKQRISEITKNFSNPVVTVSFKKSRIMNPYNIHSQQMFKVEVNEAIPKFLTDMSDDLLEFVNVAEKTGLTKEEIVELVNYGIESYE